MYEDVDHKADFIIQKTDHERVATVEKQGSLKDGAAEFAVQFTIDDREATQEYKKKQMEQLRERVGHSIPFW